MAAGYSSAAIKVDGLRELEAKLKAAGPRINRAFYSELAPIVADLARTIRAQVPVVSGAAAKSVKPQIARGYLAIKAGGADVPYYPWLDFGGTLSAEGGRHNEQHRPVFKEGRWIYPTIARHRKEIHERAMAVVKKWERTNF
jgi:hypothetical protein